MKSSTLHRHRSHWAAIALAAVLGGCSHAPGMHMDERSAALQQRAELVPLDAATVSRLRAELRKSATSVPAAFEASPSYDYRIAPQDLLRVTVWNHPELTNPANTNNELSGRMVNADGKMFFPYVGNFKVAGMTMTEARDYITRGLQRVIRQPQVEVTVLQFRGQRVYVSGEVRAPGTVPVTDVPPDLTEILARAGGVTNDADLGAVTITRGGEQLRVDLQALYYGGDLGMNVRLRHGDVVNVPERRAAKVFVMGEVIRPAPLLMPRGPMSLADALADAGGVNPLSSSAGQVFVLRGRDEARPQVFHLNAASPDALLLADQFRLNARDVVYVDAAPVVRWARVMDNVLGSADQLRLLLNDTTRGLPR